MSTDKWRVVPYGNAVANGEPESEWDWLVVNAPDTESTESIEVESRNRAEQIAAMLNAVEADPDIDAAGLRKATDQHFSQPAKEGDDAD